LLKNPRGNDSFTAAEVIATRSLPIVDDVADECWKYSKSVEYAAGAYESDYIQGMQNGNLDPNFYGQYVVEDAVYIMLCVETFEYLAAKYKDDASEVGQELFDFFSGRAKSYKSYGQQMTKDWHIGDIAAIDLGIEAVRYSGFQRILAESELPVGYVIASLVPCERLWPELSKQMASKPTPNNLYQFWIKDNASNSGKLAKMLNHLYIEPIKHGKLVKQKLFDVYSYAMSCEMNFFRSGCGQVTTAPPLPQWIQDIVNGTTNGSSESSQVDSKET